MITLYTIGYILVALSTIGLAFWHDCKVDLKHGDDKNTAFANQMRDFHIYVALGIIWPAAYIALALSLAYRLCQAVARKVFKPTFERIIKALL